MNRNYMNILLIGILCSLLIITACTKKKAPEPEPVPPTPTPMPQKIEPTPTPVPTQSPEEIRMKKLDEARKAISTEDIYFDFDKATLSSEAKTILARKAAYLSKNPDIRITIEGHCDERGSNEYNLGLGERRAAAARKYLTALGVNSMNIDIITYGEERPVCHDHNETCWSKNRRDHFVVNP